MREAADRMVGSRMSAAEYAVIVGQVLAALPLYLFAVLGSFSARHIGFAGAALQGLAAVALHRQERGRPFYGWIFIGQFVLLAVMGYVRGNWFSYWAADMCVFAPMLLVISGRRQRLFLTYIRTNAILATLTAVAVGPSVLGLRPAGVGERVVTSGMFDLSYVNLLYPACFGLFFIEAISWRWRIGIYTSVGLTAVVGLFTATRSAVVVCLVSVLLVSLFRGSIRARVGTGLSVGIVGLLLGVMALSVWAPQALGGATQNLLDRLMRDDLSSGRNWETAEFFEGLSLTELFIGRGMGGAQWSAFWRALEHGGNGLHYGYAHLILKGGLVLLGIVAVGLAASLALAMRSRGWLEGGCAATVVLFVILNFMVSQFGGQLTMGLVFLAVANVLPGGFVRRGRGDRANRGRRWSAKRRLPKAAEQVGAAGSLPRVSAINR